MLFCFCFSFQTGLLSIFCFCIALFSYWISWLFYLELLIHHASSFSITALEKLITYVFCHLNVYYMYCAVIVQWLCIIMSASVHIVSDSVSRLTYFSVNNLSDIISTQKWWGNLHCPRQTDLYDVFVTQEWSDKLLRPRQIDLWDIVWAKCSDNLSQPG